jgi:hypothetical protein
MNINELINECGGPDKVRLQYLDQCGISFDWTAKSGSKITFGSDVPITPDGTKLLGIILWLPRDQVKAAIEKARAA